MSRRLVMQNRRLPTEAHSYLTEILIIFFDFFNDSVIFQFYINNILQEYLDNFCIIYLNDTLIYNEFEIKHEIHVKHIFQKM